MRRYSILNKQELKDDLRGAYRARERGELTDLEYKALKISLKAQYHNIAEMRRAVKERGEEGFFDYCEKIEGFHLPRDENGRINYHEAKRFFIHWGQLADELVEFINQQYLRGEQRFTLYEQVKENDPVGLVNLLKIDEQVAFEAGRKLLLIKIFAQISQYLSKEQLEIDSILYNDLKGQVSKLVEDMGKEQELFEKDEKDNVARTAILPIDVYFDPFCGGRIRLVEILESEGGEVIEEKSYYYPGEEVVSEQHLSLDELRQLKQERLVKRHLNLVMRFISINDEHIAVMVDSREKPLLSFALKVLRKDCSPDEVADIKGIRLVFLQFQDIENTLDKFLKAFPPAPGSMVEDYFKAPNLEQRSASASSEYRCIKWITQDDLEIQLTDLLHYLNATMSTGREVHPIYRVSQYLNELLPILFPESRYNRRFEWRNDLKKIFNIFYNRFNEIHDYEEIKDSIRQEKEYQGLHEDEFDAIFRNLYIERFLENDFKPVLFSFGDKKGLLSTPDEIVAEAGIKDKEKVIVKQSLEIIKENIKVFTFVLERVKAGVLSDIDIFDLRRYERLSIGLIEAIAKEIRDLIVDEIKKNVLIGASC